MEIWSTLLFLLIGWEGLVYCRISTHLGRPREYRIEHMDYEDCVYREIIIYGYGID